MRKATFVLAMIVLAAVAGFSPSGRASSGRADEIRQGRGGVVEGELIVRMKSRAARSAREEALAAAGVRAAKDYSSLVPGLMKVTLDKGASAEAALQALRGHPSVLYAEENPIQYALLTPNDTRFAELFGLHNTGQTGGTADADIDAPEAWDTTTGSSEVVVGVVDTGIDYNHEDLAANIWTNPGEVPGNGVDDDSNGYIDDVHGINAITGSGNPLDDHDHGSHCSGTIGGVGNNAKGVVGVNWTVRLMGLKFLNSGGSGSTADAIEAIDYAVAMKNRGVNIRVLSNSWGGGGFSQGLLDSINAANTAGILFVAAAGNSSSNNDSAPHYPSSYEANNVVAVASTTNTDALSSFSNYGATSVDLGAPGSSILSTTRNNTYSVFSGTSMATPHVAGVAALLLSVNPNLTLAEMKNALFQGTDAKPSLSGLCVTGGRLNAAKALTFVGPPQPGYNLGATPPSQTINQGQGASYAVSTSSVGGYTGQVSLSAASAPALAGATVTFDPNPVDVGSGSTMTVATTTGTAAGDYVLTITGVSGSLTRTTTVNLTVHPQGTITQNFDNNTVTPIPENDPTGIESTMNVAPGQTILDLKVTVDITHTYIGDLEVTLFSPSGAPFVLHNRAGGSTDNLHQTYDVNDYNGQDSQGVWRLRVRDLAAIDVGTLDHWRLSITGPPTAGNTPPTVSISSPANGSSVPQGASVSFTGSASDAEDGNLTASLIWTSSLNGQIGSGGSFSRSDLSVGTHTIIASVTDSGSASGSQSVTLTVTPAPPPVTVTSIVPSNVNAGSTVSVTIGGGGFLAGASVSIINGSAGAGREPAVSNVVVRSSGEITATVKTFRNQARGTVAWDVVVRNTSGTSGTLAAGFRTTK